MKHVFHPSNVVYFKKLDPSASIPEFKTEGSSGADVCAIKKDHIDPGQIKLIPLGFAVSMNKGYELQLRPRSGLAVKHGVTVLNTPGTIDSDYRGEIKVLLINHGIETFHIEPGDRIAQLIFSKVEKVYYVNDNVLEETSRGKGGFGSTGRN